MEALNVVGSLALVLDLAQETLDILHGYRDLPRELLRLTAETAALKEVLLEISASADSNKFDKSLRAINLLQCQETLEVIAREIKGLSTHRRERYY